MNTQNQPGQSHGLTGSGREHANCGVGILMDLSGRQSHRIVTDSLQILKNLDHRGARGAEENTGDGAGILIQKPHRFFQALIPTLGDADTYGVGQIFLPRNEAHRAAFMQVIESVLADEGFDVINWRPVPTSNTDLGWTALQSEPFTMQLFVQAQQPGSPPDARHAPVCLAARH